MIEFKFPVSKMLNFSAKISKAIDEAIDKSFKELKVEPVFNKQYASSILKVRSGRLHGSIRKQQRGRELIVYTDVEYARIQDIGGTLPNGGNIRATFYWTRTINELEKELRQSLVRNISNKLKGID